MPYNCGINARVRLIRFVPEVCVVLNDGACTNIVSGVKERAPHVVPQLAIGHHCNEFAGQFEAKKICVDSCGGFAIGIASSWHCVFDYKYANCPSTSHHQKCDLQR